MKKLAKSFGTLWLCLGAVRILTPVVAQEAQDEPVPPVELTTEEDHARTMHLLGIAELRPGANPNDPNAPNKVNYDEDKANIYPSLPEPLLTQDRLRVTTPEMWWKQRRPELVELFDREIYGRVPSDVPGVRWEVVSSEEGLEGDVPTKTKRLKGIVDNSKYPFISVEIDLVLTTPANAKGPVPVMLEFGFDFRGRRFPGGPPPPTGPTWKEQVISKGWGYAVYYPYTVQADNGAGLTRGIIGLVNRGQPREVDDWGALRAWAWGASRALDYFATDNAVDATQVGVEGVSRFGKAALVAMAYDERFAIGLIASSGAGGAKMHRRDFGERVENLASPYAYHWMAGNFMKYAGPLTWDDLPIDAHELIALCAPRPVFISVGSPEVEGQWIDARGMFMAAAEAGPVYRLLGKRDLGTTEFPKMETGLVDGEIAFRQHSGGHTAGPNWPTFLEWAGRYIQVKQ